MAFDICLDEQSLGSARYPYIACQVLNNEVWRQVNLRDLDGEITAVAG
jgi:hypothetical protein